mmetsp:Transcript_33474/g.57353  ORF Transcript_33474/g.57353 Transcript_33474/m.57353 type:complete len:342 (+) Transcript_33474:260-1285(+)
MRELFPLLFLRVAEGVDCHGQVVVALQQRPHCLLLAVAHLRDGPYVRFLVAGLLSVSTATAAVVGADKVEDGALLDELGRRLAGLRAHAVVAVAWRRTRRRTVVCRGWTRRGRRWGPLSSRHGAGTGGGYIGVHIVAHMGGLRRSHTVIIVVDRHGGDHGYHWRRQMRRGGALVPSCWHDHRLSAGQGLAHHRGRGGLWGAHCRHRRRVHIHVVLTRVHCVQLVLLLNCRRNRHRHRHLHGHRRRGRNVHGLLARHHPHRRGTVDRLLHLVHGLRRHWLHVAYWDHVRVLPLWLRGRDLHVVHRLALVGVHWLRAGKRRRTLHILGWIALLEDKQHGLLVG